MVGLAFAIARECNFQPAALDALAALHNNSAVASMVLGISALVLISLSSYSDRHPQAFLSAFPS